MSTTEKRVLVCGGRDYADVERLEAVLDGLPDVERIIHGAARGADTLAKRWAESRGVPHYAFPARWDDDGKAAGPLRNAQMLREGMPDLVVAFPGGAGTADMVRRARRAGVEVLVIKEDAPTRLPHQEDT